MKWHCKHCGRIFDAPKTTSRLEGETRITEFHCEGCDSQDLEMMDEREAMTEDLNQYRNVLCAAGGNDEKKEAKIIVKGNSMDLSALAGALVLHLALNLLREGMPADMARDILSRVVHLALDKAEAQAKEEKK